MKIADDHTYNVQIDSDANGKDYTCVLITVKLFDEMFSKQEQIFVIREDYYKPKAIFKESTRKKHGLRDFFKKIFCQHKYIPLANSHDGMIDKLNFKRTYVICVKCGKGRWIKQYLEAPCSYSYLGFCKKEVVI